MRSQAHGHFPQVRFSGGQKWLFNPVLKRRFANRPEERVRLQYVEFLLHQTSIKRNRIGFEAPVKTDSAENTLRADLVIYDQDMTPSVLIECKSGRIKLNAKTAEQAARYNRSLKADYLMITNGIDDFWYRHKGETVFPLQHPPFELKKDGPVLKNSPDYWISRGFLDSNLPGDFAESTVKFLDLVFTQFEGATCTYLKLPPDISPILLDHYYRIEQTNSGDSLALSLIAGASNKTVMAAMLNREGQNRGVVWLPLTELLATDRPKATLLTPGGTTTLQLTENIRSLFTSPSRKNVKKMVNQLINLFD